MALTSIAATELADLDASGSDDLRVRYLEDAQLPDLDGFEGRIASLGTSDLSAKGLQRLMKKSLPKLTSLEFSYGKLDSATLSALGSSPLVEHVKSLVLRGALGGAAGISALTATPLFARLEALELSDGDIGDDGCAVLAQAAPRGKLKRLGLGRSNFGSAGDASNSKVDSKGLARLVAAPALASLEELAVSMPIIDAELAATLVGSPLARFVYLFPGSYQTRREAPKGGAWFTFQGENQMPAGPPDGAYFGKTTLSNAKVVEGSGGSGVFSDDGRYAAIPVWEKDSRGQFTNKSFVRLISLQSGAGADLEPRATGSLALYAMDGKSVRGIANLEDERTAFEAPITALP